ASCLRTRLPYTTLFRSEFGRSYHGVAATIDGVTFQLWSDGSEHEEEDGDQGLLRIEDGGFENVAVNERLVALYLNVDGTALLALGRKSTRLNSSHVRIS